MTALVSVLLWTLAWTWFLVAGPLLLLLVIVLGPVRAQPFVRAFSRGVLFFSGARLSVRFAPGFVPKRPYVYVSNHVNLFDPFTICAALPGVVRGLELESHFSYPLYGRLIRRLGNVPVPEGGGAAGFARMWRAAERALERGIGLCVFPEGSRTLDGEVGPFRMGAFRLASHCGAQVVPVTIEGAFRHKRKPSRLLRPARVTVHVHEPLDAAGLDRRGLEALRDRARDIVRAPLHGTRSF